MTKPNGWTGDEWEFEESGRTGYNETLSVHHEIRPQGTDGWLGGEYMCVSGICTVETARLIAAAPSLYEALAECEKLLDGLSPNNWEDESPFHFRLREAHRKARAALQRAEGEL